MNADAEPPLGWGTTTPVVACVGLSCRDHVWHVERFPPVHSRTHASDYRSQGGGPAATAAVAAARLGADARLWAIHGDDEAGRANAAELRAWGVDLGATRTVAGARSFVSAVLVGPGGERHLFPYRGAGIEDEPDAHPWEPFEGVGAVLVDARHPRLAAHALTLAAAAGVPTVGDWGDARHPELRDRVDHLVASEEAARAALASDADDGEDGADPADADPAAPDDPAPDDPAAAAAARRALAVRGAQALQAAAAEPGRAAAAEAGPKGSSPARERRVVVTLGELGCVWLDADGAWSQSAPAVRAIDTNGAGDAFHGAYAAAVAARWPLVAALRLATAVAALKCTGLGRDALPDLSTAQALAERLPPPVPLPEPPHAPIPDPAAPVRSGGAR